MSLQVWLPMNGNLDNKGLSDVTATAYGSATINTSGKIGKCYQFGSGSGAISLPSSTLNTWNENFSFSMWLKINAWNTAWETYLYAGQGSTAWNQYVFGLLRNNTTSTICFVIGNGTNTTTTYCKSNALSTNVWYHVACTYQSGNISMYINGEKICSYATSIAPNYSLIKNVYIGALNTSGTYQTNSCINDFRIYDHCLSPLEIKQISQGLICNYKLSGVGNENLINNSLLGITSSGYGFAIRTVPTLQDSTTYTLSFNGRTNNDKTSADGKTLRVFIYATDWTWNRSKEIVSSNDTIETITFTTPSSISSKQIVVTSYYFPSEANSGIAPTGTCTINWYKLEKGSIATPWCPAPSDTIYSTLGYNDGIEYDCSGYGNHGTKFGDITWSGDSARYSGSYEFKNSSYIITPADGKIVNILNSNTHTISAWINVNGLSSNYQTYFVCRTPSGSSKDCQVFLGINSSKIINSYWADDWEIPYSLEINKWYHIVFSSSNKVVTCYVNGVKIATTTKGALNISSSAIPTIGADSDRKSFYFNGRISDIRIYATALSDKDVQNLYGVSASIDKTGILSAHEFVEGD